MTYLGLLDGLEKFLVYLGVIYTWGLFGVSATLYSKLNYIEALPWMWAFFILSIIFGIRLWYLLEKN